VKSFHFHNFRQSLKGVRILYFWAVCIYIINHWQNLQILTFQELVCDRSLVKVICEQWPWKVTYWSDVWLWKVTMKSHVSKWLLMDKSDCQLLFFGYEKARFKVNMKSHVSMWLLIVTMTSHLSKWLLTMKSDYEKSRFKMTFDSPRVHNRDQISRPSIFVLQCVAVYCSVLQRIAVCCSVLQCAAVYCSVLQCIAVCCSVLQCVAVWCSVLQCVVACCSVLQCVAVCCSVLQCNARISTWRRIHVSASKFLNSQLSSHLILYI